MHGLGISVSNRIIGEKEASWDFSDEAELIIAYRSSVRVIASDGFQAFTLREGEGVFIPPRVISSVIAADESAEIHAISFPLSVIWEDEESIVYKKYSEPILSISGSVSLSPKDAALIEKAFLAMTEKPYCYELITRNYLTSILISILVENEGMAHEKAYTNERLLGMMTYIKSHFSEAVSLSDIAAAGNVSERECLRIFRKSLDTSPVQFLISYRLREGVKLLESSELQIAEISYKVGFESPSHFSRSFRSFYGVSPSEWRRRLL